MTRRNAWDRLHPGLRAWAQRQGWTGLRRLQEDAFERLGAESEEHVLIVAGTASGKTEAAFLPVLTRLLAQDTGTVLCVCPLRALIDDQVRRMQEMVAFSDIKVVAWHGTGDSESVRKAAHAAPRKVLFITPESLEIQVRKMEQGEEGPFGDLRWLIFDEFHTMLESPRGQQLRGLMARLDVLYPFSSFQHVGLSATLSDPADAGRQLAFGTGRPTRLVQGSTSVKPRVHLLVDDSEPSEEDADRDLSEEEQETPPPAFSQLFALIGQSRSLVFPNSKRAVEEFAESFARYVRRERLPLKVLTHHADLAAQEQTATIDALQEPTQPIAVLCTSTLEMGVDLPSVPFVVQVGPAPSVASLRQRLGRSGRADANPQLIQVLGVSRPREPLLGHQLIPYYALVALVQAHLAQLGDTEPTSNVTLPSLVAHQMGSHLCAAGGAAPEALEHLFVDRARYPGFGRDELRRVLEYWHQQGWLYEASGARTVHPKGRLGIALSQPSSCASFLVSPACRVYCAGRFLGQVATQVPWKPGMQFSLAGRGWEVEEYSAQKNRLDVRPVANPGKALFEPSGFDTRDSAKVQRLCLNALEGRLQWAFDLPEAVHDVLALARAHRAELSQAHRRTPRGHEFLLWMGRSTHLAVADALRSQGLDAQPTVLGVHVSALPDATRTRGALRWLESGSRVSADLDEDDAEAKTRWSWLLPPTMRQLEVLSSSRDYSAAHEALKRLVLKR